MDDWDATYERWTAAIKAALPILADAFPAWSWRETHETNTIRGERNGVEIEVMVQRHEFDDAKVSWQAGIAAPEAASAFVIDRPTQEHLLPVVLELMRTWEAAAKAWEQSR